MDGLEATRIIRSKHPETRVIVLTPFKDDVTRVKGLESEACYCWSKEGHFNGLLAVIREGHFNGLLAVIREGHPRSKLLTLQLQNSRFFLFNFTPLK